MTNKCLKLWKLKDSDLCSFCNEETETIEHIFYSCTVAKCLWKELIDWLKPDIDLSSIFKFQSIMFGCLEHGAQNDLINILLLLTKRYIYVQRCIGEHLLINNLINYIRLHAQIEQSVIDKSLKVKNCAKWALITKRLQPNN